MSGYVQYSCLECHLIRYSSNSRANTDGTVCPSCMVDARDRAAGRPEFVPRPAQVRSIRSARSYRGRR